MYLSLKKLVCRQQLLKGKSLDQYSFNVNHKILSRRVFALIFYQVPKYTKCCYRNEILEPFVNQFHDDELLNGFFQQDGVSIHCTYNEQLKFLRLSRNTEILWPSRSCDLTTYDFLRSHLKNTIFQTAVTNLEDSKESNKNAWRLVKLPPHKSNFYRN